MNVTLNDILGQFDVSYGETIRTDCPWCKGINTFSLSNIGGSLVWNCYKASCNASGTKNVMWTTDDIQRLRGVQKEKEFVLPEYITPCNQAVGDWADSWGLNAIKI